MPDSGKRWMISPVSSASQSSADTPARAEGGAIKREHSSFFAAAFLPDQTLQPTLEEGRAAVSFPTSAIEGTKAVANFPRMRSLSRLSGFSPVLEKGPELAIEGGKAVAAGLFFESLGRSSPPRVTFREWTSVVQNKEERSLLGADGIATDTANDSSELEATPRGAGFDELLSNAYQEPPLNITTTERVAPGRGNGSNQSRTSPRDHFIPAKPEGNRVGTDSTIGLQRKPPTTITTTFRGTPGEKDGGAPLQHSSPKSNTRLTPEDDKLQGKPGQRRFATILRAMPTRHGTNQSQGSIHETGGAGHEKPEDVRDELPSEQKWEGLPPTTAMMHALSERGRNGQSQPPSPRAGGQSKNTSNVETTVTGSFSTSRLTPDESEDIFSEQQYRKSTSVRQTLKPAHIIKGLPETARLEMFQRGGLDVLTAELESTDAARVFQEFANPTSLVLAAKDGDSDLLRVTLDTMLDKLPTQKVPRMMTAAFHSVAREIRGAEDVRLLEALSVILQHGSKPDPEDLIFLCRVVDVEKLDDCFFRGVSSASNSFIPALNVSSALDAAIGEAREMERKKLVRLLIEGDKVLCEILRWLPQKVYGFSGGMEACNAIFEPKTTNPRAADSTGPLDDALKCQRHTVIFATAPLGMDFMFQKFTRGLPGLRSTPRVHALEVPNFDPRDEIKGQESLTALCSGSFLGGILRRVGKTLSDQSLCGFTVFPGAHFILTGIIALPNSYYKVPAMRMALDLILYVGALALFTKEALLFEDGQPGWGEIIFAVGIVAAILSETDEMLRGMGKFLQGRWNVLDCMALLLCSAAFVFRVVDVESSWGRALYSIAAPLLFWRLLFFAQILRFQGAMIEVVFLMAAELAQFAVLMLVIMIGFAVAFYALFREVDDETFQGSWLKVFKAMLGEVGFFEDFSGSKFDTVATLLLISYLIIMSIMVLNLLIAVLSTAHSNIEESIIVRLSKARLYMHYRWVVRSNTLPPPANLVQLVLTLPCKLVDYFFKSKTCPTVQEAVGRVIFWLVMGPFAVLGGSLLWLVSLPKAIAVVWSAPVVSSVPVVSRIWRAFLCAIWCTVGVPLTLVFSWLRQGGSVLVGRVWFLEAVHPMCPCEISVDRMLKEATGGKGMIELRNYVKNPLASASGLSNGQDHASTVEHLRLLQERLEDSTRELFDALKGSLEENVYAREKLLEDKLDAILARLSNRL